MPKLLPAGDPSTWTMSTIGILILNATTILLGLASVVAAIFIVLGAFSYLTAYGDKTKVEKGKKTITWAIIGLVLIIVGRLILGEVWSLVSTDTSLPKIKDTKGSPIVVPATGTTTSSDNTLNSAVKSATNEALVGYNAKTLTTDPISSGNTTTQTTSLSDSQRAADEAKLLENDPINSGNTVTPTSASSYSSAQRAADEAKLLETDPINSGSTTPASSSSNTSFWNNLLKKIIPIKPTTLPDSQRAADEAKLLSTDPINSGNTVKPASSSSSSSFWVNLFKPFTLSKPVSPSSSDQRAIDEAKLLKTDPINAGSTTKPESTTPYSSAQRAADEAKLLEMNP